jgi:hypothetical protein
MNALAIFQMMILLYCLGLRRAEKKEVKLTKKKIDEYLEESGRTGCCLFI